MSNPARPPIAFPKTAMGLFTVAAFASYAFFALSKQPPPTTHEPEPSASPKRPEAPESDTYQSHSHPLLAPRAQAPVTQGTASPPPVEVDPLDTNLGRTEAEKNLLFDAEHQARAECMSERGFKYEPEPYVSAADDMAAVEPVDPAADGYGLARQLSEEPKEGDTTQASTDTVSEQWKEALMGSASEFDDMRVASVEADGATLSWDRTSCIAKARQRIYGDETTYRSMVFKLEALNIAIESQVEQDDSVKQAMARWRSCMTQKGYSYESSDHARSALRLLHVEQQVSLAQLEDLEVKVALADESCSEESELAAARDRTANALRKKAIEKHQPTLREFASLREPSLARAAAILGSRTSALATTQGYYDSGQADGE